MTDKGMKNILADAVLFGIGLLFLAGGLQYELGSATNMGPGYFPVVLGSLAILIATVLFLGDIRRFESLPKVGWRPLGCVVAGMLIFLFSIDNLGLIPAVFLCAFVSSYGDKEFELYNSIKLGLFLSFAAWVIFIVALRMQIVAFRGFF